MFRNLLIFIISSFLLQACNQQELIGRYEAGGTLIDRGIWFLKGKRKFFAGNQLSLNKDSTFQFTSCGCVSSGDWFAARDSVFLNYDQVDQSADTTEVNCYLPPHFAIRGNTLIGENQGVYIEIMRKKK